MQYAASPELSRIISGSLPKIKKDVGAMHMKNAEHEGAKEFEIEGEKARIFVEKS